MIRAEKGDRDGKALPSGRKYTIKNMDLKFHFCIRELGHKCSINQPNFVSNLASMLAKIRHRESNNNG